MLPPLRPMPVYPVAEPFDDPDWLFEIKYDGFRALAFVEGARCRLLSRRGHLFQQFTTLARDFGRQVQAADAILDGEIVCLDEEGRPRFEELLQRRGDPIFAVFDILWLDGRDQRGVPLSERKGVLAGVVPARSDAHLVVDGIRERGVELFHAACEFDLEGVVAKWLPGLYQSDGRSTSWVKIKNPDYTQGENRGELFEDRGERERSAPARLLLR